MITTPVTTDTLERVGTALADPTRRRILLTLTNGPAYPADLAESLATGRSHISTTLRASEAGLLRSRRACLLGEARRLKRRPSCPPIQTGTGPFAGFRFPPEVIVLAVRWYLRFGLSYRDLEELLAERGIEVDHVTLYRWVQRFTPLIVEAARPCRHAVDDRWFVDETDVKVAGTWRYVYRAVDQHGQVIDVYVSKKRDAKSATRFFSAAIRAHGEPAEVTTDRSPALARTIVELLPGVHHDSTQYANNRIEADHGRLKARLSTDARAQAGSDRFGGDPKSRVHAKPPPRTLRTRHPRAARTNGRGCVRRTRTSDLTLDRGGSSAEPRTGCRRRNRAPGSR
jgi:transposase-like protein